MGPVAAEPTSGAAPHPTFPRHIASANIGALKAEKEARVSSPRESLPGVEKDIT